MTWDQRLALSFEGLIAAATIVYVVVALLQRHTMTQQLQAMQESNDTNREALTSVQRAFVSLTGFFVIKHIIRQSSEFVAFIEIQPLMEDGGVTPARHVTSHCNYQRIDASMPDNFDFPDQWYQDEPQSRQEMGIGPKSHVALPCTGIPIPDLCALKYHPNDTRLYWWGHVRYSDIFGTSDDAPDHVTQFCDRIVNAADSCFDAKTPGSECTITISSCGSTTASMRNATSRRNHALLLFRDVKTTFLATGLSCSPDCGQALGLLSSVG
jgi:hypothetical protein